MHGNSIGKGKMLKKTNLFITRKLNSVVALYPRGEKNVFFYKYQHKIQINISALHNTNKQLFVCMTCYVSESNNNNKNARAHGKGHTVKR